MKRYLAIGAGALVLLAGAWGLFWWSGRGEVERAFDEAVAGLQDPGWTITWKNRSIRGFPFGYAVELTGIAAAESGGGMTVRLPWAVAETQGTDSIVVHLPDSFVAEMPAAAPASPEGEGAAPPPPSAPLSAIGEADALIIVLTADGTVEVSADRLAWTLDDPESGRTLVQSVEALEATSVPEAPGARYRLQAALVGAEATLADAEGTASTVTATVSDVAVEGASTVPTPEALGEMLYAGGPGQAEGSMTTGPAEMHVASTGQSPGTIDWRADGLTGRAALTSGRMELHGETRGNSWTLSSADATLPVQGTFTVPLAQATYAVPMAPSGRPDDMAIRVHLQEIGADEAAWSQLDPAGSLPREPATLLADVTGTMRVTERIDRLRPGAEPPFEVSTLMLRELSARALGASVNATGEVEILQPVGVPLGEIQVGATGLGALIGALGRAGILSPDMVTTAEAIMSVYLRPAGGTDAWTAEIAFTRAGTLVNGLPVR